MGNKFKDKSNNDILLDMKQMEYDYEALKNKLIRDWDKLVQMEEDFKEATKIINDRLKNNS
jgi:hypothetical protein